MVQFKIIQSGNQIESQSEAAAAIPVFFRHNPKYLQMPDHVFHHDSLSCQFAVCSLLLFAQLFAFRFLSWCLQVFMLARQTLITAVRQTFDPVVDLQFALLEQLEIVRVAFCLSGANNAPRFLVNDYLRLLRCAAFSCPNSSFFVFFRTFDHRFGCVDDNHLKDIFSFLQQLFARQTKIRTLFQNIFYFANNPAHGRLTQAPRIGNMELLSDIPANTRRSIKLGLRCSKWSVCRVSFACVGVLL